METPLGEPTRLILVRLSGEIATKARATRAHFERRLLGNLRRALAAEGIEASVHRTRSRIFVETADPAATTVLARIFGVQSLSAAVRGPGTTLAEVVDAGAALFADAVAGRRFAVRARRVGDRARIPLGARDVERALGARLLPHATRVDLDKPDVTARVELHDESAYFFTEAVRGPGGLPLGVEGRAIALVSGGFDSAVAAWQMLRRGVELDYVFCNLGGSAHQLGVLRVLKVLADRWSYGARPHLHAIDFAGVSEAIRARTQTRYWQVLLKRRMLQAADAVAAQRGADALVTGEALGQVSSQTLRNLAVIARAVERPVLRPLVGWNKDEIIAQAERIGTAPLSAVIDEYCAMVPRRPATAADLDAVQAEEARLDPALVEKAVTERQVFDLRHLAVESLGIPELDVHEVPEDATLLDLRSRAEYDAWHPPGALHLPFDQALAAWPSFERERRYVLCCEIGLKSAHLAELMSRAGFDVHHVAGGARRLQRKSRARPTVGS